MLRTMERVQLPDLVKLTPEDAIESSYKLQGLKYLGTIKSTHVPNTCIEIVKNVPNELKLKFMELFIVRACDKSGETIGDARFTDDAHLETCIKYIKHDYNAPYAYVNHATMCFDGYLVNGHYVGKY